MLPPNIIVEMALADANLYELLFVQRETFRYRAKVVQHHAEIEQSSTGVKYKFRGRLHREDGPAVVFFNGECRWYRHGKLHRVGGPAIEGGPAKEVQYFRFGLRHRDDGPAIVDERCEHWYYRGRLHRDGGPAVTMLDWHDWYRFGYSKMVGVGFIVPRLIAGPKLPDDRDFCRGNRLWYCRGELHRADGPAVERFDGAALWFLLGKLQKFSHAAELA